MSAIHPLIATLLALALALPTHAMPAGNPPGTEPPAPAQAAPTLPPPRAGSAAQADADFRAADAQMARVYHQVLDKYAADKEFIARFRASQRAWLAFRDAEVAATYPANDKLANYGSVYPLCVDQLKTTLTMHRIEQLNRWRDGTVEGDVCAGSVKIHGDAN